MGCGGSITKESYNYQDELIQEGPGSIKELLLNLKVDYVPIMFTEKFITNLQSLFKSHLFKDYNKQLINSFIEELVCEVDINKVFLKVLCFFTLYEKDSMCIYREINKLFKYKMYKELNEYNLIIYSLVYLFTAQFNELQNEQSFVYRYSYSKNFQNLKIGQIIYNKDFYFTTVDNQLHNKFEYFSDKNCLLKIKCYQFNDQAYFFNYLSIIDTNIFNKGYKQIVFSPFTKFKVVNITKVDSENFENLDEEYFDTYEKPRQKRSMRNSKNYLKIELEQMYNIDFIQMLYDKMHLIDPLSKTFSNSNYKSTAKVTRNTNNSNAININKSSFSLNNNVTARRNSNATFTVNTSNENNNNNIISNNEMDEINEFYYENQIKFMHYYSEDKIKFADTLEVIGILKEKLNKNNDAIQFHQKVLKTREYLLGKESKETALSYFFLGSNHMAIKDYKKAIEYLNDSLDIRINLGDNVSSYTSMLYNSLGLCYVETKEYDKAVDAFNLDIDIYLNYKSSNKVSQSVQEKIASIYNNLGLAYKLLGDYALSLQNYKNSLNILKKFKSTDSNNIANLLTNIALIFKEMKDYDSAYELLLESLSTRKDNALENQVITADAYYRLARFILEIKVLNVDNNLDTVSSGKLSNFNSNAEEAFVFIDKAVNLYEKNDNYDIISDIYFDLAENFYLGFTPDKIEQYYEKAILNRYKYISKNKRLSDYRLIEILYKYGLFLIQESNFSLAITSFEQLVNYLEKDNYSKLLIEVYYCLALCYEQIENYAKTVFYYQQVLNLQRNGEGLVGVILTTNINNTTNNKEKTNKENLEHVDYIDNNDKDLNQNTNEKERLINLSNLENNDKNFISSVPNQEEISKKISMIKNQEMKNISFCNGSFVNENSDKDINSKDNSVKYIKKN